MTDPRYTKLAALLVDYSTALKKGDRVLVDATDVPDEFVVELMRAIRRADATPLVEVRHSRITREILRETTEAHAAVVRDVELFRMKKAQAYIDQRAYQNANEDAHRDCNRMHMYPPTLIPSLHKRNIPSPLQFH